MTSHEPREFLPAVAPKSWWVKGLVALLVLVCLLPFGVMGRTALGASGIRYELTPAELIIHYPPAAVRIPRSGITRASVAERLTDARRRLGTSLPGLYTGRWSFAETGIIYLYNTTTSPVVVLETAERKWGITPVNPQDFVASLQAGETGTWEPLRSGSPLAGLWVLGLVLIPVSFALAALLWALRVPGKLRYTLQADGLEIRAGWIRKVIPYARITGVAVESPPGWPWRTFGASLPGLHLGDFRWRGLSRPLQLYATRLKPLVLISTGLATYGITPAEEQEFIAELNRRRAGG